jgi:hypothetical protein
LGFGQARKRALPNVWWVLKVSLRAWLEESVRALDQAPAPAVCFIVPVFRMGCHVGKVLREV